MKQNNPAKQSWPITKNFSSGIMELCSCGTEKNLKSDRAADIIEHGYRRKTSTGYTKFG